MNTTYDEIYQLFLDNCKMENIDLPQTDKQKYGTINNAIKLFNNKMRDKLKCDNDNEKVSRLLNDDELLIIIHYIRLTLLKNNLTYKNSFFDVFTKEIGIKNINAQTKSIEHEIIEEKQMIDDILFNNDDTDIMG